MPSGLPRLARYRDAVLARPSVKATMQPPEPSRSYMEQMADTYRTYIDNRRKAAAAAST